MPSTNYTVNFSIVTSDTVEIQVSACSEQEAVQIAENILSPELDSNQYLELENVTSTYSRLTTPTNNNSYTSLSSFYQSAVPAQEAVVSDETTSLPPTPGYSRLIN